MAKIKGVFIDAEKKTAEVLETEGSLEAYYKLLKCGTIDIVSRRIGGKYFDIICDDEGLFAENVVVTMCKPTENMLRPEPMLVGNLFICKHDGQGNEKSLTDEEIAHVMARFMWGMLWGEY